MPMIFSLSTLGMSFAVKSLYSLSCKAKSSFIKGFLESMVSLILILN